LATAVRDYDIFLDVARQSCPGELSEPQLYNKGKKKINTDGQVLRMHGALNLDDNLTLIRDRVISGPPADTTDVKPKK
jgi:hypothetical protein